MTIPKPLAALLAVPALLHAQEPDAAQLYTLNCAACHMLDQGLVGPSLVEIRKLYLGKEDDFVKWAIAPGKKRPGAVDMPSMIHVGEPGLRAIYKHMIDLAKDAKEKPVAKGDPFAASPTQAARPQVQRIFLPDSGPASIAIALDKDVSLCWDAGECRLRYAWTGGFIDGYTYWKGNGSSMAKISGKVRHTEDAPLFKGTPVFHGYEIKNGLPVFRYTVAGTEVAESFEALPAGKGFVRRFTTKLEASAPSSSTLEKTPDGFTLTTTFTSAP